LVRGTQEDAGGETLSDEGALGAGLVPRVPQTHLSRSAGTLLSGILLIKLITVRIAGAAGEQ